ncbi:hypothetical protein PA598K_06067 [Paenibacillus sp. 598K]|uniref:GT-D fold domain-containing protein n=1 Tax=Paenibacillus sp. 598K TaxID=1117987 RepID=UPI000FFA10F0|nr:GT-D fold domain-containing glycosyltransferase [Paenibacillus sp. 598K]GBF77513.1 hypothetical protein PA598K_06067 [Paenibacillus sp. 598K]
MQRARKLKRPIRLRRGRGRTGRRKPTARKPTASAQQRAERLQEQIRLSYNQGYDAGYDAALIKHQTQPPDDGGRQREEGYRSGLYEGGEGLVDVLLSDEEMLPDIPVYRIIEAGIQALQSEKQHLLNAREVTSRLLQAMDEGRPLSVVRLGDGELLTMAQGTVMSDQQLLREGHFLPYAGIQLPDLEARDQLVAAVCRADIVGIPKLRLPNYQPLAFAVFRAYGIDYRQLQLTISTINYTIYLEGCLPQLLQGRRVLLVGNTAPSLASVLESRGYVVAGVIAPVAGMHDIPRVMAEIHGHHFDIALVGAGIPAVVIAQRIATELGRTAIDFGHLADALIKGEAVL